MDSGQANSPELPPHLRAILADLEKADQQARRIAAGLSDAQANWHPGGTGWSVAQCLDHLGRANTVYAAALHQALRENPSAKGSRMEPIQPGWFSRLFIRSFEPPPKRKLRAPEKIVPGSQIPCLEALQAFLRGHDDVRTVIREGARLDLNRIRFRNPFITFLRFTVGTGLLVLAAHDRRHLWQAERVLESPGFPR
jgi:DinB superfamily